MIYIILLLIAVWIIGRFENDRRNQTISNTVIKSSGIVPPSNPCYDITGASGTTITGGAAPSQPVSGAFTQSCGTTLIDITAPQSACLPPPFSLEK